MAEKKQSKPKTNEVIISGYLKENTLEVVSSDKGSTIRGNLIIAVDELNSIRAQFNVSEKTYNGEESKDYENLLKLLPENTTSIANYLETNPENGFEEAIQAADKVWVRGALDEYTRLNDNNEEVVSIQVRGYAAGFKKESTGTDEDKKYTPHANFTAKIYLYEMKDELDEAGSATGRILISGLIQKSDQSMIKIPFVVPTSDGIADYIKANYKAGGTVFVNGNLVNVRERIELDSPAESGYFGSFNRKQYRTRIVNERVITGGSNTPLTEGMEGALSKAEVKLGLAKRSEKIEANTAKANAKTVKKANFGTTATTDEEVDF